VSNIVIADNLLLGHHLGIDMASPAGHLRYHVVVANNISDINLAEIRGSVMRFVNYDDVVVRDNRQPTPTNREMAMVSAVGSCNVTSVNNDLVRPHSDQMDTVTPRAVCPDPPAWHPVLPANFFAGQRLTIDAGNTSTTAVTCTSVTNCTGYLAELADHAKVVTSKLDPGSPPLKPSDRTMLMGNVQFSIPIRNGNYRVTMTFVEPELTSSAQRRINVESERERKLVGFDPYASTGGRGRVVHRGFDVTVGDGTLEIRVSGGAVPAVVSFITIDRA
jgi:hypothetical protein